MSNADDKGWDHYIKAETDLPFLRTIITKKVTKLPCFISLSKYHRLKKSFAVITSLAELVLDKVILYKKSDSHEHSGSNRSI